jgi:hypothetical protein
MNNETMTEVLNFLNGRFDTWSIGYTSDYIKVTWEEEGLLNVLTYDEKCDWDINNGRNDTATKIMGAFFGQPINGFDFTGWKMIKEHGLPIVKKNGNTSFEVTNGITEWTDSIQHGLWLNDIEDFPIVAWKGNAEGDKNIKSDEWL